VSRDPVTAPLTAPRAGYARVSPSDFSSDLYVYQIVVDKYSPNHWHCAKQDSKMA
jgi:hypothetical protein